MIEVQKCRVKVQFQSSSIPQRVPNPRILARCRSWFQIKLVPSSDFARLPYLPNFKELHSNTALPKSSLLPCLVSSCLLGSLTRIASWALGINPSDVLPSSYFQSSSLVFALLSSSDLFRLVPVYVAHLASLVSTQIISLGTNFLPPRRFDVFESILQLNYFCLIPLSMLNMAENIPPASLPPLPSTAGAPGYHAPPGTSAAPHSLHMPPPPLPPVVIPQNTNPLPTVVSTPGSGLSPGSSGGMVRRAAPEPNKRALYVGGLDPRVSEDVLRQIFETTGHVQNVKIIPDKNVSSATARDILLSCLSRLLLKVKTTDL